MLRAIDRKLVRDIWAIKSQALAIALVISAGVAVFVMYLSNFSSLTLTQQTYYDRYRFADVFASLKRAPHRVEQRLAALPGVTRVDTRVVVDVTLDVEGLAEPATGRLISMPVPRRPVLNDVFLRSGRYLEPNQPDEVLASEAFAIAHGLAPGDSIAAIINGRRRQLEIVGTALSPEYVYGIRPGDLMPDARRFGLFWMERQALATAFDMEGGFNDVAFQLARGASANQVIAEVDRELEAFGGLGAIPRSLQLSHWSIQNEIDQLGKFGYIVPAIFLLVAAFLLNVVLTRIVSVQREQIAALKALGYSNRDVGWHYTGWSLAIAAAGGAIGVYAGMRMGAGLLSLYNDFFRFPVLTYRMPPWVAIGAVLFSLAAALLGAFAAVRNAVRLPPAEAMRPEPPATYRISWLERVGLRRVLAQSGRMVVRNIHRRPFRTFISVVGIAFAVAILVVGTFFMDSINELLDVQFNVLERQDVMVSFIEPLSARAIHDIAHLDGVMAAQPTRSVPVRLRHGHRHRQLALTGLAPGQQLRRVVDADLTVIEPPPAGLVLSRILADTLALRAGDEVVVEVLEGARPVRHERVVRIVDDYMGMSAYMAADALHRFLREGENRSGAYLQVDSAQMDRLYEQLKVTPAIAGVAIKRAAVENFEQSIARNMNLMVFFNVIFSVIIAVGVVYNAARISLSERSRELASLRVMGFTRGEISSILLGELAVVTLLAIPLGLLLGYAFAYAIIAAVGVNELYRMPFVVASDTFGFAALVVLLAAAASGMIVRRRLDHLDLVAVLKTRE